MKKLLISLFLVISTALFAGDPVPNVKLIDQDGKTFQFHDLKGQYVFLSFVFTRCPMPKMCPLTITLNKQLLREWKKEVPKQPLKRVIVNLDPEYDTPAILKGFAKSRSLDLKNFILATGEPKALSDFEASLNVIGFPAEGTIS